MLRHTRRRALGLLLAAAATLRFPSRAGAAKKQCFELKPFGPWKAQATDAQAGARINEVSFVDDKACDLRIEIQVAASFESKLVIYGDPDQNSVAQELPDQARQSADRQKRGRHGRGRRAAMRQLHRHLRRQGQHRAAARLRAAVPRGEVVRDGGQARRQGGMPLQARLRDVAQGVGVGLGAQRRARRRSPPTTNASGRRAASSPPPVARRSGSTTIASSFARSGAIATRCWSSGRAARTTSPLYYELAPLILARLPVETRERATPLRLCPLHPAERAGRQSSVSNALAHRLYRRMIDELAREVHPGTGMARDQSRAALVRKKDGRGRLRPSLRCALARLLLEA